MCSSHFWLQLIQDRGSQSLTPLLSNPLLILRFGISRESASGTIGTPAATCPWFSAGMGILKYLRQDLIAVGGNVLDMPALVLSRMLRALPSRRPFPVQNYLASWNAEGRLPHLQSNDDLMIVDGIMSQLPLAAVRAGSNVPVLTRCQASLSCNNCGRVKHGMRKTLFRCHRFTLVQEILLQQRIFWIKCSSSK